MKDIKYIENLIVRYLNGECNNEEQRELKSWIDASTDHKKEFLCLKDIWDSSLTIKENYSLGYASGPSAYGREIPSKQNANSLITAAIETAKNADVVIFIGGLNKNHFQDCEAGDRKSLDLPFGQDILINELVKANKNTAVVLFSGNAVSMPWLDEVPAILQGWYLGSEAGNALADVMSGEINPSGRLPFSFPKKLDDCGAHSFDKLCYPGDSINVYYQEDILVGYRWHDTKNIEPLFPFGYGLSYTSFEYTKPAASIIEVSPNQGVNITEISIKDNTKPGKKPINTIIQKQVQAVYH